MPAKKKAKKAGKKPVKKKRAKRFQRVKTSELHGMAELTEEVEGQPGQIVEEKL
ncbi:MAG: hypothetical protein NTW59_03305 [Candidatus Diapherotrites archaeon]|nr:hypothetical protein [Candidatus Diapherotrites archaeon]